MAAMLQTHSHLQRGKEGFNDAGFAQEEPVQQGEEVVVHVAADASDQVQAPLPQALHEGFADVALISEYLAPQWADHALQWLAIIHVAACDLECPDLALMVMSRWSLKPKNQPVRLRPRWARSRNTLLRRMRGLWQTASLVLSAKWMPVFWPR